MRSRGSPPTSVTPARCRPAGRSWSSSPGGRRGRLGRWGPAAHRARPPRPSRPAAAVLVATLLGLRGQAGAGALEPDHVVFVGSGQTLSEIAAHELPGLSVSDGIIAIQLANDLSTAQVSAGQELVIPRG